jgi:hypothetical protein
MLSVVCIVLSGVSGMSAATPDAAGFVTRRQPRKRQ